MHTGKTQMQSILKLTGWSEVGYKQIHELVMTIILCHYIYIYTYFFYHLGLFATAWPAKQILMLVEFQQLSVRDFILFYCGQGIRMWNLIIILFTPSHHHNEIGY